MKIIEDILLEAYQQGIQLRVEEGKLKCHVAKGTLSSAFKEKLSQHKEPIIQFLLQARAKPTAHQASAIKPLSHDQGAALSSAQQQLWFQHKLCPELPVYNESLVIHINERILLPQLEKAFVYLINRHASLRTSFREKGEAIIQVINPTVDHFLIEYHDVSKDHLQEQQIRHLGKQALLKTFDLTHDSSLFKAVLFCCNEQYFQLHLIMHHLVVDGSSAFTILVPELQHIYHALVQHQQPILPALPVQYADYAVWQQQSLKEPWVETSLAYWRQKLANPTELKLPYDSPQMVSHARFHGSQQLCIIDIHILNQLRELAKGYRTTLYHA